MHPTPHRKRVIITAVATANIVIGAAAAAVKPWRHCNTIERKTRLLVCHDELTARLQRYGFDSELLTTAGPGSP